VLNTRRPYDNEKTKKSRPNPLPPTSSPPSSRERSRNRASGAARGNRAPRSEPQRAQVRRQIAGCGEPSHTAVLDPKYAPQARPVTLIKLAASSTTRVPLFRRWLRDFLWSVLTRCNLLFSSGLHARREPPIVVSPYFQRDDRRANLTGSPPQNRNHSTLYLAPSRTT
jgi:hypothetical protein